MYKEIVDKLLSYSDKGHLQVDFDLKKKVFIIKSPIFTDSSLIDGVKSYVIKREGRVFTPHVTFFDLKDEAVWLVQEIPFRLQTNLRFEIDQFLDMSKKNRKMLYEIAVEEKYKDALKANF